MATKALGKSDSTALIQAIAEQGNNESVADETSLLTCPTEIVLQILSFLNEKDLASTSLVCRYLYHLSNDNLLWKDLFIRTFPFRASKVPLPMPPLTMISWKPHHQIGFRIESNLIKGVCQERLLPAHAARVTNIVHHQSYLLTADCEGKMKIHSPNPDRSYDEVQTITGCEGGMIQFYPETGYIAFPTANGSVQLMHKPSADEPFVVLQTIPGNGSKIGQLVMAHNHLLFVTSDNNFYIWTKGLDGSYAHENTVPNIVKFTSCADGIAMYTNNNSIDIWTFQRDNELKYSYSPTETTPPLENVCELQSTKDHLFLYNIYGSLKIFAKDVDGQFKEIQNLPIITRFQDSITSLRVHEDYLITGSLKGQVRIFKKQVSKAYEEIQCAANHSDRINKIVMKEDLLCIGSTDATTSILRRSAEGTFVLLKALQNLDEGVTSVAIEDDRFISGYNNGQMRIWDFT